ncbi:MAG TPA: 16S rRNA (adenine(1518)-N(6)/adenine(1519)-N(6))-dimethyltransferase RsmA [bacterium]|nr:16S rRNA (adenine(1518)-N(6)/adenine(1519)-N(6))-dimethyltransferase RsmA [bacterium]
MESEFAKRAKKSLGQNFLVHEPTLRAISTAVGLCGRNVLEVGPGYGALTEYLLEEQPDQLHLVELDNTLVEHLRGRMDDEWLGKNVSLSHVDILEYRPKWDHYSVVANIPYYITSPILFRFLYEISNPPEHMVILMQREVADRIIADDGKSSLLSLALWDRCVSIVRIADVPARYFRPAPKVDSVVLRFDVDTNKTPDQDFVELLKRGFSQPRKKLSGNLAGDRTKTEIEAILESLSIRADARPESLGLSQWRTLSRMLQ